MRYVIQVYTNGNCIGWLKAVSAKTFSVTKNLRYAKKYKESEMVLAQGDCDYIAAFTNGRSIGSIDSVL